MAYRPSRARSAPRSRNSSRSRSNGYGSRSRSSRASSPRRRSSAGRIAPSTLKIVVETVGSTATAARQPLQVEAPAPKKASFPKS